MKVSIVACLLIFLFGRCSDFESAAAPEQPDALTIRTGTSFGMCAGYCATDYVFNGTSATLTQSGTRTQTQNSPKTCQSTLSPADWTALKALADVDAFGKQPETLGCPDCADGGAEYVELQQGDRKHRVTFEFNKTIPGFEPLVEALRRQRAAFTECK